MRKVLYAFIGVFGFILVFCISGLISYFLFPDNMGSETPDNIYADDEAMAQINLTGEEPEIAEHSAEGGNASSAQAGETLTIVTPALDRTKTLVRRGTIDEILPNAYTEQTSATEFVYDVPEEENNSPDTSNGGETVKPGGNNQTGSSDIPAPSTGNNQQSSHTQPETPQPEEPQIDEVAPEAAQPPQNPQPNPNVQTSDTGL